MLPWHCIHTVLLDMDGTLLDLRFDNHFWLEHMPRRYSEASGKDFEQARDELMARYRQVEGTLDWYCLDYWRRELGLDVVALKHEVAHLIAVHPHAVDFLDALREAGKRVVLVTNAHPDSLRIKMEITRLEGHFDRIVHAHSLGLPKEQLEFWPRLRALEPFDPASTLLVDDNLAILHTARNYGIGYLISVLKPDSLQPLKEAGEFLAIANFSALLPLR